MDLVVRDGARAPPHHEERPMAPSSRVTAPPLSLEEQPFGRVSKDGTPASWFSGHANGSRERAPDDERKCARVVTTGSASSVDARRRAPHHEVPPLAATY